MKSHKLSFRFLTDLVKGAGAEFVRANAMRLSAALSYYSAFSIAPLLLIAIGIAGWFYGPAAATGKIEEHLTGLVGWEAAKAIQAVVKSASEHGSAGSIIGFITLLVGASTVFNELKDSLNTIWEVQPKPGLGIGAFIRGRLLTFGMVLVIGFLLLVSLLLAAIVTALSGWLEAHLGLPKPVAALIGFVLPLLVETVLFALLFRVLPDAEIEWRSVWVGAAITAVLFEIGKVGLSFYIAKAGPASSFGAAGSVVIILLWVYYASCIVFFGASITEVYARMAGHSIQPAPNAESTELTCAGGDNPIPVSSAAANHPRAGGKTTTHGPAQESLAPLIARTMRPDPVLAKKAAEEAALARAPLGKVRLWMRRANEHPFVELLAALGVGVAAGTFTRFRERT